jgi:hypothetical protein
VPAHLHSVLSERLQNSDKEEAIELYYELLSSGHSVGEILDSLGRVQCKSERGDVTTAEHSPSGSDGMAAELTSDAALGGAAQANARCIPGASPHDDAEICRNDEPRVTESIPLDEPASDKLEQLAGERLPGSDLNTVKSAAEHTSLGGKTAIHSGDQEPLRPARFSNIARRIGFGAFYTLAVASASIASFAIVSGGRNSDSTTARIQSDTSSGTAGAAIPGLLTDRSEIVAENLEPNKPVVNADTWPVADTSPAPGPSRPADPGSARPQAGQPDATRQSNHAAAALSEPVHDETHAAAPAPSATAIAPDERRFSSAATDALVDRGDAFFAAGDLASARLFYEYATAAGNGTAALRLGGTFDPAFLARARIGRVQGHPPSAVYWYRRARDLGSGDAEILLRKMENNAQ